MTSFEADSNLPSTTRLQDWVHHVDLLEDIWRQILSNLALIGSIAEETNKKGELIRRIKFLLAHAHVIITKLDKANFRSDRYDKVRTKIEGQAKSRWVALAEAGKDQKLAQLLKLVENIDENLIRLSETETQLSEIQSQSSQEAVRKYTPRASPNFLLLSAPVITIGALLAIRLTLQRKTKNWY